MSNLNCTQIGFNNLARDDNEAPHEIVQKGNEVPSLKYKSFNCLSHGGIIFHKAIHYCDLQTRHLKN